MCLYQYHYFNLIHNNVIILVILYSCTGVFVQTESNMPKRTRCPHVCVCCHSKPVNYNPPLCCQQSTLPRTMHTPLSLIISSTNSTRLCQHCSCINTLLHHTHAYKPLTSSPDVLRPATRSWIMHELLGTVNQ